MERVEHRDSARAMPEHDGMMASETDGCKAFESVAMSFSSWNVGSVQATPPKRVLSPWHPPFDLGLHRSGILHTVRMELPLPEKEPSFDW